MKCCEQCVNCIYLECGDMICDKNNKLVYENFYPTVDNMWCNTKEFEKR